MKNRERDDFMDFVGELREALSDPDLASFHDETKSGELEIDARRAARDAAEALGKCRLFGIAPGDLDGSLSPPMAIAALHDLHEVLPQWTRDAEDLEELWTEALGDVDADEDADDLCVVPIYRRLQAWAVMVAAYESLDEMCEPDSVQEAELEAAYDAAVELLAEFDDALNVQREVFASVADCPLFENWRAGLVAPYADKLPWYLDGTLDQVAAKQAAITECCLPSPETWQQWREALRAGLVPGTTTHSTMPLPAAASWREALSRVQPKTVALAEKEASGGYRPPVARLLWISPDQRWVASLVIPAELDLAATPVLSLSLMHNGGPRDGESVTPSDFDGEFIEVSCGGVAGLLSQTGVVELPFESLQRATSDELRVAGDVWTLHAQ